MTPWHIGIFTDTLRRQYPVMANYTAEEDAAARRRYYAGMLCVAPRYLTSAETAKERLKAISKQDREACNDGKWVKRWRDPLAGWDIRMGSTACAPIAYLYGRPVTDPAEVQRYFKPRYRWQVRR
ncbi:MAG TPA: hypothetical protein VIO83_09520 [Pseudomonas sp.]